MTQDMTLNEVKRFMGTVDIDYRIGFSQANLRVYINISKNL